MNTYGLNQEGYPDPTATQAVAAATKAEKKYLPLVYICSKYSGDTIANTEAAKRYSRFAVDQGAIPLAPHLLLPLYMKEETERELAMFMDMVFLGKVDQLCTIFTANCTGNASNRDYPNKVEIAR